jgi:ubiquinone/menaquinone biosynthesis C-methylase UbiE
MRQAAERFSAFADDYDRARPHPPRELTEVVGAWAGLPEGERVPVVVDVGAGTGISTVLWAGRAERVVALEPSAEMRAVAARRCADAGMSVEFGDAVAEDTGLPDGCADVVTASQALHWFDPERALPEIARILRPGGVFAAYDCDWPPCVDAEVDAAYHHYQRLHVAEELRRDVRPPYAAKGGHADRMRDSGRFRHVADIALSRRDSGDADRLLSMALSQGGTVALLAEGISEETIGLDRLREVAERRLATPRTWWWTYRVRLAVV